MAGKTKLWCAIGSGVAVLGGGSVATAGYTAVSGGGQGGAEPSVWNVMNALLGSSSLTQAEVNAGGSSLGGITGLRRVEDGSDQFMQDGPVPVSVMGLFYGNADISNPFGGAEHDLYYENETAGGSAVQVIDGTTALGSIGVGVGEVFSLTAVRGNKAFDGSQDNTDRAIASSVDAENVASGATTADRMVTFEIDIEEIPTLTALDGSTIDLSSMVTPTGSGMAYIHFFDTGSDADYQDAVYLTVNASLVPLPGPASLGAAGLAGVCVRRRRRS